MKTPLLQFLACPVCRQDLQLSVFVSDGDWIEEGTLTCACGLRYPVIEGIPVMLEQQIRRDILGRVETEFWAKHAGRAADSRNAPSSEFKGENASAAKVWGYQWQDFHELWQDEYGEEQFYRWLAPLRPEDLKGRLILDGGCGTGRHALYSAKRGAVVIGIDLSFATRVAARITRDLPNAHIVQADLYRLPFPNDLFDRVYSIGVIHHLPDPRKAYLGLVSRVKPGGSLTVWVYGRENNWLAACAVEFVRSVFTRRLPLPLLKGLCLIPTVVLWSIIRYGYAPLNRFWPAFAARLPYNRYFMLFYHLSFRHQWMNVFDKLNAPIANYYPRATVEEWIKSADLADSRLTHTNDISWSLHGIRR